MIRTTRLPAALAGIAMILSACGGAAAPSPTPSPTPSPAAATTAAASTPAATQPTPTPTSAASGQGAAVAKLAENKLTLDKAAGTYLPAGGYVSTISLVTLEKGGRTLAHKHGGIEAVFVLEGTVDLRTTAGRATLKAGTGGAVAPETDLQAFAAGDAGAKFLAFFLTKDGAAFQTAVTQAPAGAAAPSASLPAKSTVAASGQGAAVAKLAENKLSVDKAAGTYLPAGGYVSTISLVTLDKGGRTVAHKHGGIEAIFVLEGTVDLRSAAGSVALKAGTGAALPPDTDLQAIAGGDAGAKFLAFFLTKEGAAFQTNVTQAP